MAQPVVISVAPVPAEPREALLVTGTGFGFVSGAFFEDVDANLIEAAYFQIADGQHIIVTVPASITTDADYTVVLTTLEDEISVDQFGTFHVQPISGNLPAPTPPATPDPFPLPVVGTSVGLDRLRSRVRNELADMPTPFQSTAVGDGITQHFDLPVRHVEPSNLTVTVIANPADMNQTQTLTAPADYQLNSFDGSITLTDALTDGSLLIVSGTRYKFFDNTQLDEFIETAFAQITHGRTITTATVSQFGYRVYGQFAITYDTLPELEILPTAINAKIQALWVLATDASYDIDISEDGANIPRSERYRQILGQIQAETARYSTITEALNIGINRIEMNTLRRVSRLNGRLVPVYVEKEYDDHSLPIRVLPGVDHGVGEGQEFVDPYYQAGADYGGGFGP